MSAQGFDRAAFVERMTFWKPLRAALERALGPEGAARWLEKAAKQIRREQNLGG